MPLAPLIPPYDTDDTQLLALCIWREARGEPIEAKFGVSQVIANRTAFAPQEGFHNSIRGTVLVPWAFSSFMVGDPNAAKYPGAEDKAWQEALEVASIFPSSPIRVGHSVFYHSYKAALPTPTQWGTVKFIATIGRIHFFEMVR